MSEGLKNVIRAAVPRELRNWLRSPSKSAEWIWDSARFSLGGTEVLDFPGGLRLICHPYAAKIYRQLQLDDPEQREEFANFICHCRPDMMLFDVGAHFGAFSLAAAHLGGSAVAVDPSPTAAHMIAHQARLNHSSEQIRIVRAAISDTAGSMDMLGSGAFTAGYFRVAKGRMRSDLTRMPALTIDDLARQFGAPSHIKIDVEGHEAAVLRGARSTFATGSPLLFLEFHTEMVAADGGNPAAALDELASFGYNAFSLDGRQMTAAEILAKPIVRVVARRAAS